MQFYGRNSTGIYFGEVDENLQAHGNGVVFFPKGDIRISYFQNGKVGEGNYVYLHSVGSFNVGDEFRDANGYVVRRRTHYT